MFRWRMKLWGENKTIQSSGFQSFGSANMHSPGSMWLYLCSLWVRLAGVHCCPNQDSKKHKQAQWLTICHLKPKYYYSQWASLVLKIRSRHSPLAYLDVTHSWRLLTLTTSLEILVTLLLVANIDGLYVRIHVFGITGHCHYLPTPFLTIAEPHAVERRTFPFFIFPNSFTDPWTLY